MERKREHALADWSGDINRVVNAADDVKVVAGHARVRDQPPSAVRFVVPVAVLKIRLELGTCDANRTKGVLVWV